jgi:hypothetical protein
MEKEEWGAETYSPVSSGHPEETDECLRTCMHVSVHTCVCESCVQWKQSPRSSNQHAHECSHKQHLHRHVCTHVGVMGPFVSRCTVGVPVCEQVPCIGELLLTQLHASVPVQLGPLASFMHVCSVLTEAAVSLNK